eukprot:TRINITY_DN38605_c0_g1_i1.p1 TRINITY_DN38605_c0_g1~~TRINITY_DN38605_c0_g1_i1.p1  ORF type:complete len:281 (+),score=89.46 TRINITY_DN38605_c0_g1_i1:32-844(+)
MEDSVPHRQLITVSVWAMLAVGKGFILPIEIIKSLLESTRAMAAIHRRVIVRAEDCCSTRPEDVLNTCIGIRKAFGGMGGDVRMLGMFEMSDLTAATTAYSHPEAFTVNLTSKDLLNYNLPEDARIHEAVDFHCCRYLLPRASQRCIELGFPFATEEYISQLWWGHRSGVYTNKPATTLASTPLDTHTAPDYEYWQLIVPIIDEVIAEADPWSARPSDKKEQTATQQPANQPSGAGKRKAATSQQPTLKEYLAKKKCRPKVAVDEVIVID